MESRLNTFMTFYNITQKELADATGINRNTIGRYASGLFESISKEHLDLLCSFFKCSLDSLFEVDITLPIIYPSIVIENSIRTVQIPKTLVITTGTDVDTGKKETISYFKPESEINKPIPQGKFNGGREAIQRKQNLVKENPYEPILVEDDINYIQERFNLESKLSENIFLIADCIIYNADTSNLHSSIISDINKYKSMTDSIEASKFIFIYRILCIIIIGQMYDANLLVFINEIKDVYSNSVFFNIDDDELNELLNKSNAILNELKII